VTFVAPIYVSISDYVISDMFWTAFLDIEAHMSYNVAQKEI